MVKVYLASPLGFSESTRGFIKVLKKLLKQCGLSVVDPWSIGNKKWFEEAAVVEDAEERRRAFHRANMRVAAKNERAIRDCTFIVAVLDGVDVDSGTASEIGFGYALGKRIYGYRGDIRRTGENEGSLVNLQVQYWIENSGGCIVASLAELSRVVSPL